MLEIDVAQEHLGRYLEDPRGEIEDRANPGPDHGVGHPLGYRGGRGDDPDGQRQLGRRCPRQLVGMAHHDAVDFLPDDGRVGVDQRRDPEVPGGEPLGTGEGPPRFPMPAITTGHTRSSPSWWSICSMRNAASYPAPLVPNDPSSDRSLRTLAALRRAAEASTSEETVGGARPQQLLENPLVDREAGHRGLGDPPGVRRGRARLRP